MYESDWEKFRRETREEMDREICRPMTLQEYREIQREVEIEVEETKRIIARMERGEYF